MALLYSWSWLWWWWWSVVMVVMEGCWCFSSICCSVSPFLDVSSNGEYDEDAGRWWWWLLWLLKVGLNGMEYRMRESAKWRKDEQISPLLHFVTVRPSLEAVVTNTIALIHRCFMKDVATGDLWQAEQCKKQQQNWNVCILWYFMVWVNWYKCTRERTVLLLKFHCLKPQYPATGDACARTSASRVW